jgi:predicted benzoate:H+ symporter BenE
VNSVDDVFEALGIGGGVLIVAGVVLVLMGWGGMDERLPTQVPPRRFAGYALAAGLLLVAVAALARAVPGG